MLLMLKISKVFLKLVQTNILSRVKGIKQVTSVWKVVLYLFVSSVVSKFCIGYTLWTIIRSNWTWGYLHCTGYCVLHLLFCITLQSYHPSLSSNLLVILVEKYESLSLYLSPPQSRPPIQQTKCLFPSLC